MQNSYAYYAEFCVCVYSVGTHSGVVTETGSFFGVFTLQIQLKRLRLKCTRLVMIANDENGTITTGLSKTF